MDIKIYVLKDFNDNIRYVGITKQTLNKRLKGHLNDKISNTHKINWINKLKRENVIPIIGKYKGVDNPTSVKLYQYDLTEKLLNIWDCCREFATFYNFSIGNVSSYAKWNSNNIDYKIIGQNNYKIIQKNLKNELINEYENVKEASLSLKKDVSLIHKYCKSNKIIKDFYLEYFKYNQFIVKFR